MTTPFDGLQRCTIITDAGDRFEFPITRSNVQGGLRDHVHEFPHSPGGQPENLGRKLYVARIEGIFDTNFSTPATGKAYDDLWPYGLAQLRKLFETGQSFSLVLPTLISPFRAYCFNWSQTMEAKMRSGETTEFEFREASENDQLLVDLERLGKAASLEALNDTFKIELQKVYDPARLPPFHPEFEQGPVPSIFDGLDDAVNQLLAIKDNADAYQQLALAKIERILSYCEEANDQVQALRKPEHWFMIDAFRELWSGAIDLANDVSGKSLPIAKYVTPHEMAITEVAGVIYNDTGRTIELQTLNPDIPDPYQIAAGTELRYYVDAA